MKHSQKHSKPGPGKLIDEQELPYVLNITATPPARNQSALAAKLGN
jgi:hypothetical protein